MKKKRYIQKIKRVEGLLKQAYWPERQVAIDILSLVKELVKDLKEE